MNEAFEASLTDLLTPAQHRVWTEHRAVEIRAAGGPPALRLFLDEAGVPLDARQMRLTTAIYETTAGRLRRAEAGGAVATGVTDIENEALVEVADVLTPPQVEAVLTAAGPGVSRGPVGGPADPGRNEGSASQPPGPASAAPDTRFGSVVRALRALARPTAAFVGGATASGSAASSEQIAQIRINNNQFTTENFGGRGAPGFGNFGGTFAAGEAVAGGVARVAGAVATSRSSSAVARAISTATSASTSATRSSPPPTRSPTTSPNSSSGTSTPTSAAPSSATS